MDTSSTRARLVGGLTEALRRMLLEGDAEGSRIVLRALGELAELGASDRGSESAVRSADERPRNITELSSARGRRQGIGKSTFFRILAGEWFSDTEMALDKDAMMQLRAAWIYEWAELENVTGRQSVSRVKAFLTSTEDKYRPPFGRTPITVKGSGVIVGSTNNQDFLHDPSGSRRFWVVPVGAVHLVQLRAQREQLLAEAVAAHQGGERRWLNEEEEARRAALATRFVETDPWEARVLEFAAAQQNVRTLDVLTQGLGVPLERLTRRDEMRDPHPQARRLSIPAQPPRGW